MFRTTPTKEGHYGHPVCHIPAAAEYSIVKAADSGDYAAVYNLTKGGVVVGASINIPKDMVVKSGSVVDGNIVLVLNDEDNTEITIPASSLIEYVTSGSEAGDMVVVTVSDDHKVTATITDGTIGLEKLATDVQTKINKAHSHENATVLNGITADKVEAWDNAEANAKAHATDLNTAMNTRVEALEGINHEAYIAADETVLNSAKGYTDSAKSAVIGTEGDAATANTIYGAKKHAEEKAADAQAAAESKAAQLDAALKTELQGEIDADVKALAEGAVATNAGDIAVLKGTGEGSVAKALADAKAYADTAESDAVTSANAYTDSALTWGSF